MAKLRLTRKIMPHKITENKRTTSGSVAQCRPATMNESIIVAGQHCIILRDVIRHWRYGLYPLRETEVLSIKVDVPKEGMSHVKGTKEIFT